MGGDGPGVAPDDLIRVSDARIGENEVMANLGGRSAPPRAFSAGVIVVRPAATDWRYLVLRAFRNWDFPKGEVEPGESPIETAVREVNEETSLEALEFHWGHVFRETEPYARGKLARYYLAASPAGKVRLPVVPELGRAKHDEFRWATRAQAERLLPPRLRPILAWAASLVEAGLAVNPRSDATGALDAALGYLARGWSVIPVQPRGKRPLVPWLEFQQRSPSTQEAREWWTRWPDANVAVVTGAFSGVVVLDVDVEHGGRESLAHFEREHGALSDTVEGVTGSGGRHVYFAHPGGVVHNRVGIDPGIDLRGDGGYVVAPPSIHPSGGSYRWLPGHEPGAVELAVLPAWLRRRLGLPGQRSGHPLTYWRALVHEGVEEGERNNSIASLAGYLLRHGTDPVVALDLLLSWNAARCRPPLSEDEVVKVVESITRLHERQADREGPA